MPVARVLIGTVLVLLATAGLTVVLDAWLVEQLGAHALGDRSNLFLALLFIPLAALWAWRGVGGYQLAALAVFSGGFMVANVAQYWLVPDPAMLEWTRRVANTASLAGMCTWWYLLLRESDAGP